MNKLPIFAAFILIQIGTHLAFGDDETIKPFKPGSYQQILTTNANQPLMLVIWSIDCPSCLKDMSLISDFQTKYPKLKIVMLTTDEVEALPEIQRILANHKLTTIENWAFAADNPEKLRYEIDPAWYGELPRTYFFDATHQRVGKSGALLMNEFEAQIDKLKI
jgi:thiol-disulfide isomerase/thioredoxin